MSIDAGTVLALASAALEDGEMDVVRIHEFELDGDAHDDATTDHRHKDFKANFDAATKVLNEHYGPTSRIGDTDDDAIPLAGIVACNIWDADDCLFFLAVAHEDRGAPFLMMLGCAE
jgi:hypothetical protein